MYINQMRSNRKTGIRIHSWLLALVVIIISNPSSADFTKVYDLNKCGNPCWEVTGSITKSDLSELSNFVDKMNDSKVRPTVRLDTIGGDMEVAVAIGRQLRRYRATVFTWDQGKCYSSCVFILAGAVRRYLSSNIGIHRPFSNNTDKNNYYTIQGNQRRLSKFAKKYLEEVNVSPSLYDAMVSIPSDKIKILSERELEFYGIVEVDPVEQELDYAAKARRYGLSMAEFIQRKSQVNRSCAKEFNYGGRTGDFDSYRECERSIFSSHR